MAPATLAGMTPNHGPDIHTHRVGPDRTAGGQHPDGRACGRRRRPVRTAGRLHRLAGSIHRVRQRAAAGHRRKAGLANQFRRSRILRPARAGGITTLRLRLLLARGPDRIGDHRIVDTLHLDPVKFPDYNTVGGAVTAGAGNRAGRRSGRDHRKPLQLGQFRGLRGRQGEQAADRRARLRSGRGHRGRHPVAAVLRLGAARPAAPLDARGSWS